jgi:hypothetical protein
MTGRSKVSDRHACRSHNTIRKNMHDADFGNFGWLRYASDLVDAAERAAAQALRDAGDDPYALLLLVVVHSIDS